VRQSPEAVGALPSGTVTFLFTDIEGSTRLLAQLGDDYMSVLADHRSMARAAFERWRGVEVDTQGDSFFVAFESTADAVSCGLELQRAMDAHAWPDGSRVRVRMGIHAGEARVAGSGYVGIDVHRAARIMAAGHGGQVLLSGSAAALVQDRLPDGASLTELGEHRLKDLERREPLFQLTHADLAADFPALRTLDYWPNNLPAPVSVFVGREPELSEIVTQLAADSVRLITLTGPGGTGKTRLALRAAANRLDRIHDGAFFVDLAPVTDAESALAVIARVLGATLTREQPLLEDLKRWLRDRSILLVLDNFEQVTVAAGSIAELLEACPTLKVLVTSREALHIRGEQLFPVPPLSLPPAVRTDQSAEQISRFEAIQLFVERARAVRPDFRLTDDNAAAVADICRRLDGLPLAIELATARINLFSPEALRDRLTSRLKTLDRGARDLPARQQTLRATIDWSYQLLEAGEKRLFELLSVFGAIGIDAVEQVARDAGLLVDGGLDPIEALASLLDKSLLRFSEAGAGGDGFVMLETIREFAGERLVERPDLAEAGRRAHAMYFTTYAKGKLAEAVGQAGEPALSALALEIENLRTAWRHWVSVRDLGQLNSLVECLWLVYQTEGRYQATVELTTELLDVLSTAPSSPERALQEVTLRTSHARALMAIKGYTAEVEEAYARALELFEGQRDRPQIYPVLRDLARFYVGGADFEKTARIGEELLRLAENQGDAAIGVDARLILATARMFVGDLRGARAHLDLAMAAFESPGYPARRVRFGTDPRVACLTTAGFLLWFMGSPDLAAEQADRAVALAAGLDPYSHAYALFHSGFLHLWRSEPHLVDAYARQLLEIVADHDFPIWRALATCLLGVASVFLGRPAEGLAQVREGMAQYQGMRSPPVFWPFLRFVQAASLAGAGQAVEALALVDDILTGSGDRTEVTQFLVLQGDLRAALGQVDSARASYQDSLDRAEPVGAAMIQLQVQVRLTRLRRALGEVDDGSELRAVYDTFTEGFETRDLLEARALLTADG
jgi:predicted ATPase/class 3 adenylate cyclase